nr:Amino-acid acetyltransferase, mitochondrial [Polyrhizophydium stewartii]
MPTKREARSFLRRYRPAESIDAPWLGPDDALPRDHPASAEHPTALVRLTHVMPAAELSRLAKTLAQLRQLGLFPIVVVASPDAAGRPFDSMSAGAMLADIRADAFRVAEAIDLAGTRAVPIVHSVFVSTPAGVAASLEPLRRALRLGQIPVVACIGEDETHMSAAPLPAKAAVISLANESVRSPEFASPAKFILVNARGGIAPNGRHVGFVNLTEDYDNLCGRLLAGEALLAARATASTGVSNDDAANDLELLHTVLRILPSTSSGVLTSAEASPALISNLITDKPLTHAAHLPFSFGGAEPKELQVSAKSARHAANLSSSGRSTSCDAPCPPTIFRLGLPVERHTSLATVDTPRMHALLEASFQRRLDADAFFARISEAINCVLVAGNYDGAVIVTNEIDHRTGTRRLPYLDKFAVAPSSQGIGVADILWTRLNAECPNLSWRSRSDNPVNKWYFERSDGTMHLPGGKWTLFWYGERGLDLADSYKQMAASIPPSFL